jgi:hypothetical protein
MAVRSEDENSRRCVAAAFALCIVHILTIVGTDYQVHAISRQIARFHIEDLFQAIFALLVNYGTFLSPVFLLLLIRRTCILVGILAVPILIFFAFRMYYVWQFYSFGINSMAVQKGDALGFLTVIFEMLTAGIVAFSLLVILSFKLIDGVQRIWKR